MKNHYLCFFLVLSLFLSADAGNECVYTLYVKTGSKMKGGTDSIISVSLGDAKNHSVRILNLKAWGAMGECHDYFERGNIDAFTGRGPCLESPVCHLNLTSDGSGLLHGWYCDYVEVTSTGPHKACSQTAFSIDQWLSKDVPPYNLTVIVDGCKRAYSKRHALVVGNTLTSSAA